MSGTRRINEKLMSKIEFSLVNQMVVADMATASSTGVDKSTVGIDDQSADRNVEMWKIKKLIKSLEAARG